MGKYSQDLLCLLFLMTLVKYREAEKPADEASEKKFGQLCPGECKKMNAFYPPPPFPPAAVRTKQCLP